MRKEFARVAPEDVGIRSEDILWLLDELESGFTEMHGLQIMRDGRICAEGWWQPYAPGLVHGLQSLSKTYAATAVGIACTEGLLTPDTLVADIFPDKMPDSPSQNLLAMRVRDVLCMGCGMDQMSRPSADWIRDFLATPVPHAPGTCFMYNSTGSTLLGAMVRAKSGLSLHEYLTPRLFDKIGIDAKNLMWMRMPDGMEVGGGGLYATTEDNLRLMKLYADGGVWEGERILSEEYVELATSAQNDSSTEAAHNPHATDNFLGYGYQIWMCAPEGVYRADGAMGQFCVVDPKRNLLISLNETAMGAHWAQKTLDVLWSFLARVELGRQALPENPKAAQTLRSRMAKLALPAPDFSWNTGCARVVSGVTYAVEQGSFRFENSVGRFMSGSPASEGIRQFVFDFSEGNCTMEFVMDEETHVIAIATDGSRRWNILPNSGSPCTKLYASGAWREEDTFSVTARWIESCFERQVNFSFADESVTITTVDAIGGFGPGPGLGEDERAVARRLPGRVADF